MKITGEKFKVLVDDEDVEVVVYEAKGTLLYHVQLKSAIFLTKFIDTTQEELWTIVPQGNFKLATKIGKQIDKYIATKGQQKLF